MTDLDPNTALGLVHGARQSVADRVDRGGWGFDVGFGLMAGGVVASWALRSPYDVVGYGLCGATLYLLAYLWARRTGLRLGGVSRQGARRANILIAIAISLGILSVAWFARHGLAWTAAPVAVGVAVAGFLVSRGWRRMWLRDIERMA